MKQHLKSVLILLISMIVFNTHAASKQTPQDKQALVQVLTKIGIQYKVNFLYEEKLIKAHTVQYDMKNNTGKSVAQILDGILSPLNLSWSKIDERNYSIFSSASPKNENTEKDPTIKASVNDSLGRDRVSGQILDEYGKALDYVTVTLLAAADSSFIVNSLTDPNGRFTFSSVKPDRYIIRISAVGRGPYLTKPFTTGATVPVNIGPITMPSKGENLKEVKITGSKPLVESKTDRLILNVENSAMAVGNSLQVLKSAPFVRVSADNKVSLQGKRTMVLIDGKPIPETSLDNILQTMPAGNILKIELITQPSAKYDAAYGAVINIITKKSQIEGLTGNLRADASTGKYAIGNINASATYKKKNLTVYASGGIAGGDNAFGITSERYQDPSDPLYYLSNNWRRISHNRIYNFQASAELQLTKEQTLGFFIDAATYRIKGPWATTNSFGRKGNQIDSMLYTDATFNLKISSANYNLNYHLLSDSGKNELTVLATLTPWMRDMNQLFPSILYNAAGDVLKIPPVYQTRNKGNIGVFITQADYTHQFKQNWKFDAGLKYQYTDSKTTVSYADNRTRQFQQVSGLSSQNNLQESITGAYMIFNKDWKDDKFQGGLRLENTQADFEGNFKQHYTNLFPTLLYQHNLNKDVNVSTSYRRTISRAPYNELVPYTVLVNQYTIEQGNPALVPEFDHVFNLNANIYKLNLSLSYTRAKGLIGLFPVKQDLATKVTYYTRQNLNNSSDLSLYLFYPYKINDWWETLNSGTPIGYNNAEGMVLGKNYKLAALHSDFKSSHIFKISEKVKFQVDAYYWTNYVQDLSHNSGNKNIDASLLVNLWDGNGQFRIGGNELVFKRNDFLLERNYGSFHSAERIYTDSKRIFIGFTYKFGKSKIQKSNTKLGNEDALKRL